MRIASNQTDQRESTEAANHFSCNTDEGHPRPRTPDSPSRDFADSLAVFATPKRIGLKSHIRLSGVLIKSSSITSSDVSMDL